MKNLNRIREIHNMAERYLSGGYERETFQNFSMTGGVWWTRAELLAWPERKERLRRVLTPGTSAAYFDPSRGEHRSQVGDWEIYNGTAQEQLAKGFGMYREQLDDVPVKVPPLRGLLKRDLVGELVLTMMGVVHTGSLPYVSPDT